MQKRFSYKLTNLSWICAVLVVIIHAGTYAANLPGAELQTVYGMNYATFLQLFFTEGICRVAVPLFFLISGYLYYRNYQPGVKWHTDKMQKRLRSNGIPYLFWSLAVIAVFFVAQLIPATKPYFSSESRDFTRFTLWNWLDAILINPMNSPLWFLRDLLILSMISPALTFLLKRLRWIWAGSLFILWIVCVNVPLYVIRWESLLFFNAGALLALHCKERCEQRLSLPKPVLFGILFAWIALVVAKTFYLCGLDPKILIDGKYDLVCDLLGKLNILVGIAVVWVSYDAIVIGEGKVIPFAQFGFLMFVTHHPIIGVIKKLLLKALGISYFTATISFVAAIILTVAMVVLSGYMLKKYLNKLYLLLTGGR